MRWIGPLLALTVAALLLFSCRRTRGTTPFGRYGWVGIGLIAVAMVFRPLGWTAASTVTLPLCWAGLLLALDAALPGASLLRGGPQIALWMAQLSLFSWLPFEFFNERLPNWAYVGFPSNPLPRYLILGWLFATATPVFFLLTQLLAAAWRISPDPQDKSAGGGQTFDRICAIAGALLLLVEPSRFSHGRGFYL